MNMPVRLTSFLLAVLSIAAVAAGQSGQTASPPPAADSVVTQVSVYQAYDQNLLQTAIPLFEPLFSVSGFYSAMEANVGYVHPGPRATISLSGQGAARSLPKAWLQLPR